MTTGFTLDANEKVIAKINRHWIDLLPIAASSTVMIILALALDIGFGRYHDQASFIPASLVALLNLVIIGLAVAILLLGTWVYRQNYMMLTNLHLIQVVQSGLFNRQVSQLSLSRVQDVTGRRAGLLATILNFGDVEVQSASEQEKFVFRNAPAPQELADQCLLLHEKFLEQGRQPLTTPIPPPA